MPKETKKPYTMLESYTVGRVPDHMLVRPERKPSSRYSPKEVGKTSVNFWMTDDLLEEIDRWRAARRIATRTGAVKQMIRFVLAQPWPGGNAPPLDAEEDEPDPRVEADEQEDAAE